MADRERRKGALQEKRKGRANWQFTLLARIDRQREGGRQVSAHTTQVPFLFLSLRLSCGAEEMASIHPTARFPGKKTCTLLFAKIHAAFVPGMNYATLIAPSLEVHSDTPPSFLGCNSIPYISVVVWKS